jgi:hypothetical protein
MEQAEIFPVYLCVPLRILRVLCATRSSEQWTGYRVSGDRR